MGNSKNLTYIGLMKNPPKLTVKENAREVILTTISCMCDNEHTLTFKKNTDGDFKLHTGGFAYSNWLIKHDEYEIEWEADAGNWHNVFSMINTGTEKIGLVRSR